MNRLHFRYEMQLLLDQEVRDHHFLIRCIPMESENQHTEQYEFKIEPADTIDQVCDGFGNRGYAGAIRQAHDYLMMTAEGIVRITGRESEEELHPMYKFPSAFTVPDEAIRSFLSEVKEAFGGELTDRQGLEYLMNRLYGRFVYAPGVTNTKTTAAEGFAGGCGVCQDYAHIFISLCRLAGVPCRYVAGMMVGEGETHAWAEVWLDGRWYGMDPTNNRMVDHTYIKLTHGRDFADSTIDRGCFLGFAGQKHQIRVKVEEIS